MLMPSPRMRRMDSSGRRNRSSPAKLIFPSTRACGGNNRMMANEVADLPEPDSPTNPSVPDSGMLKLTSRTAATSPVWVAKLTFKCSTWSSEDIVGLVAGILADRSCPLLAWIAGTCGSFDFLSVLEHHNPCHVERSACAMHLQTTLFCAELKHVHRARFRERTERGSL